MTQRTRNTLRWLAPLAACVLAHATTFQLELALPASGEDIFVEISLPSGTAATGISHAGFFDPHRNAVKWGPLDPQNLNTLIFSTTTDQSPTNVAGFPADSTGELATAALQDADGDGLSDDFEQTYGVTDPFADDDGDGLDNLTEQRLGTDPRDIASSLNPIIETSNDGTPVAILRIPALFANESLTVESTSSLDTPNWQTTPFTTQLQGNHLLIQIPLPTDKAYYRISL